MSERNTARIAELNDLARTAMGVCSTVIQTPEITRLPAAVQSRIREAVENFNTWTKDNDPYGERDFGAIDDPDAGLVFWKIDYYDARTRYGSEDPADPSKTTRVLTIMLGSEY